MLRFLPIAGPDAVRLLVAAPVSKLTAGGDAVGHAALLAPAASETAGRILSPMPPAKAVPPLGEDRDPLTDTSMGREAWSIIMVAPEPACGGTGGTAAATRPESAVLVGPIAYAPAAIPIGV